MGQIYNIYGVNDFYNYEEEFILFEVIMIMIMIMFIQKHIYNIYRIYIWKINEKKIYIYEPNKFYTSMDKIKLKYFI